VIRPTELSSRPRVVVVLGTRPEAIKLFPVILQLRDESRLDCRVVVTGQHREMVDDLLRPLGIVPDLDLELERSTPSLNELVARMIPLLETMIDRLDPAMVVVQGDTTTAYCAALAAFHRGIKVAHVEAGLRSFDRRLPFPEEANRRMITVVSHLHFAPTDESARNLYREGVPRESVIVTGNTAVDALLRVLNGNVHAANGHAANGHAANGHAANGHAANGHAANGHAANGHASNGRAHDARLTGALNGEGGNGRSRPFAHPAQHVLITLHRRESWMDVEADGRTTLETILGAIRNVAQQRPDVQFSYPVHPNPRVREPAERVLGDCPNIKLLAPQPYLEFVQLMASASLILTDSGGIQEEAPSLGIPVLVARDVTERPEGVAAGCNRLVGTHAGTIERELLGALDAAVLPRGAMPRPSPYGDGLAAARIRQAIAHSLVAGARPEPFVPELALAAASN
jgi:UDP-N-acetylglucosamine 2-epimerase